MKPAEFDYERPETLKAALALMQGDGEAMALAGGQSLMAMMNFRVARPGLLVDLNGIADLAGIAVEGDRLRIGAMTRYAALEASREVREQTPLVAKALPSIAHPAIRNRGTLGGSLALADPAAELPAVALALGATLHAAGRDGTRDIAADDFFLGAFETALQPGELLTAASFPVASQGDRFGFYEIARRHGDYAMAGVAVARTAGGVRLALFGIGDGAMRAVKAEGVLTDDPANSGGAAAALDDLDISGDANGDAATKLHLARVALKRALRETGA